MSIRTESDKGEDKQGEEEGLAHNGSLLWLSDPLLHPQHVLMVQGQKRSPHKIEEGTKRRTAVGENETPRDRKNPCLAKNGECSCTPAPHQGEPGAEEPIKSWSIP